MKKIKEKINLINEELKKIDDIKNQKLFLTEMKKIGIDRLPYAYSALKQFIDPETMKYHYSKHYVGYVDKLNDALSKKDYGDLELEDIIKTISRFNKTIRNNAGGAFNHALFWKMLSPTEQKPHGEILKLIKRDFKTYAGFKKKFNDESKKRFGSGWVWLVLTKRNTLKIISTPNQDNPLMNVIKFGGYPLLGLDLWEHAYYLKYKNKRDEYITNFWKVVNWEFVTQLLEMKLKTRLDENRVLNRVLTEAKSEMCSRQQNEEIRFIFNVNPTVKWTFRSGIDSILKEVFGEYWYEKDEYEPDSSSGVYDLETKGRSVLNKLNTNYSGFCVLLNDVNQVLKKMGKPEIVLTGLTPQEQVDQTKLLLQVIDHYKFRIFNQESSTFQNIMRVLEQTNSWGEKREDDTIVRLKKEFGDDNVTKIGKLGGQDDMIKGVDVEVNFNGDLKTGQIKPFSYMKKDDNKTIVFGAGNVKQYNTDWIIFTNNKETLIFDNFGVKIIVGNYIMKTNSLKFILK
jgi:Fe-Mn family superoxide dismutase